MTVTEQINAFALWWACDYCEAEADQWCVTKSGRRAVYLHSRRTYPVQHMWSQGWQIGWMDGLESALRSLEWATRTLDREGRDVPAWARARYLEAAK